MKCSNILFLLIVFSIFSCSQSSENGNSGRKSKKGKKLVMTPMTNPQTGELLGHIPLPKKWKIKGNQIVGPNGIEAQDYQGKFFTFQQRRLLLPEELVRQDFAPSIYQEGGEILGTFVIPELQNYDRAYNKLLWKFSNPRMEFNSLGVDMITNEGKKMLMIIRQVISRDQYGNFWSYSVNAMQCDPKVYEEAKNDYIFALSHVHPNMEAIAAYNRNEIAKSNASWAAHSARMAANQAAFNARNQAWMDASNSISDMSMEGWRSRNAMNDAGHSSTINSIAEEETIYNSASGEYMQVEAGSNRYFTNSNNEYIRTDNYLYDPNLDNTVNMYEWKEWKRN